MKEPTVTEHWFEKDWEDSGVPGPSNEPEFLATTLNTAMKVGAVETLRRLQMRFCDIEKRHIGEEHFERIKGMPIYSKKIEA